MSNLEILHWMLWWIKIKPPTAVTLRKYSLHAKYLFNTPPCTACREPLVYFALDNSQFGIETIMLFRGQIMVYGETDAFGFRGLSPFTFVSGILFRIEPVEQAFLVRPSGSGGHRAAGAVAASAAAAAAVFLPIATG